MRRNGIALAALLLAGGAASATPSGAPQLRCGWLDNGTPGNFELLDRTDQWTIAEQGGYQADGFDAMPDMSSKGTVLTNGSHGFSCACITAIFDRAEHKVVRVIRAEPRPLRQCRADRRLRKMQ